MKNLYLFSILLAWTLCLPSFLSAQSDGANRIAAIRARLDTLTLRDEAYLGEVDLSVGEALFISGQVFFNCPFCGQLFRYNFF